MTGIFLAIFSAFTITYQITLFLNLPQYTTYLITPIPAFIFFKWLRNAAFLKEQSDYRKQLNVRLLAIFSGIFCASVYSWNPDDTTFFHRIAIQLKDIHSSFPIHDTRIALDHVPAMSSAHLLSSWELGLTAVGTLLGQPLLGYHVFGSFLAGAIVCRFYSKTLKAIGVKEQAIFPYTVLGLIFLFFDASDSRRIGSWLLIRGWTGKCLLVAALIALLPVLYNAWKKDEKADWGLLFCLVVAFTGLTGSSLFILPLGLGLGGLSIVLSEGFHAQIHCKLKFIKRVIKLILVMGYPIMVGIVAIHLFGGLQDSSYWSRLLESDTPWYLYISRVLDVRHLLWMIGVFLIFSLFPNHSLDRSFLRIFFIYNALVIGILMNPLLHPLAWSIVPSDGYWRVFFLYQYPLCFLVTFYGVLTAQRFHSSRQKIWILIGLGVGLILHFSPSNSLFALQSRWDYQIFLHNPLSPKLEHSTYESVQKTLDTCPLLSTHNVVFLAPEPWEVVAQQLEPSMLAITARHMEHVFAQNSNVVRVFSLQERRLAQQAVVGQNRPSADLAFRKSLDLPINLVVVRPQSKAQIQSILAQSDSEWTLVSSDSLFSVFTSFSCQG